MIFDTHAHYDDKKFDADRREVLAAMPAKGVSLIVDPGCDGESSRAACALAQEFPFVYAAVGWHPEEWQSWNGESMALLRSLCAQPKVVAIGEIGLDYHYDLSEKEDQKKLFDYQLKLAKELGFPVSLHIREAFGDAMEILRANKDGLRGVMHCFSGSVETARECLDLGLYIALGGAVTFKNAVKPIEVAKYVPADRLLLETDCPYMTPVPHRGKRNDPSFVPIIAQCIADARGEDADALAKNCLENGKRLFGIS